MIAGGEDRGMFKTMFVNADGGGWLAGPIFLPSLPERGEQVSVKEKAHHGRAQTGNVTRRDWTILSKDPGESEVIISVSLNS